ncbi:MAG: exo-alpha-sialidase [Bacteroidales bacterium]|nr:exo-alpha-sialidase [Bacteroidales bacterium]
MKNISLISLLILFCIGAVQAQISFGEMQNISSEYGPSDEQDIANSGDDYFLVWNQWGDIMFRKSENGGLNWGAKLILYSGFDYGANYPVIAVSGNKVYIVYYRNTSGNSEIFLVKSENGGQSFGNEIQVSSTIHQGQVPQIVASGDTVVIAYEDRDANWYYQIYLTYSTDAGNTWSDAVALSNTTGHARWCNLAKLDDKMVVVWNEQTGATYNNLDLFVTKTTDFGQSWSAPVNITNDGAYNARLNTKIIGNSIYVIVSAKVDGLQSDIMLYRSDDFGENWQTPVNLSDNSGASSRPDFWITPNYENNHRIYAVWSDETYTGNERAYLKYSIDNGYSWSEMLEFSNASEDAAWVQIVGEATGPVDDLYMVWYRPDDGTFNYEVWGRGAENQVSSEVNLSGIISDEDENPVGNATVALGGYVVFSLDDGSYSLDVPAGTYDFSVSAAGFQNYQQPGLELFENTVLDVSLTPLVPGNYPPHNIKVEQQGVNDIFVSWEAPIGFGSIELAYDDGEANGLYWVGSATGNEFMATAFEHNASCYLRQLKIFTSPGSVGEAMKVWILGDENGSPDMNNLIGGPYLVDITSPWTIANLDIPIPANVRFYIACQWETGNLYKVGGDLNQPDGFSYSTSDGGETWFVNDEMDFMIRAGIAFDEKGSVSFIKPASSSRELMGYNLYLDGNLLVANIQEPYASIQDLTPGYNYSIGVSALYDDGESPPVLKSIFIQEPLLFPPLNLVATEQSEPDLAINLTWDEPASAGEWLHWDDGQNSDAVGGENIEIFDAAIRFTPEDLSEFDGQYLTKVSIFIADANAQFFIRVWQGGNQNYAGELIREQFIAYPIANEWNTYDLLTPVLIDASQELWMGYRVINTEGVYPAGTNDGPAVPFKGDMLLYGSDWVSMDNYFGWDINWNIQGFVVDAGDGKTQDIGFGDFNNRKPKNIGVPGKITSPEPSKPFLWEYSHFNVYNQDQLIGRAPAGTFEFLDEEIQMYNVYKVTTAWDTFESNPSNEVIVSYVGTEERNESSGQYSVWPNPARDIVHVQFVSGEAEKTRISVYDIYGNEVAVMYDGIPEKGTNEVIFNFSKMSLTAGIYFLKINQERRELLRKVLFKPFGN